MRLAMCDRSIPAWPFGHPGLAHLDIHMITHPKKTGISQQSARPVPALGDNAASAAPFHQATIAGVLHCATIDIRPDRWSVFHEYSTIHPPVACGPAGDTRRCLMPPTANQAPPIQPPAMIDALHQHHHDTNRPQPITGLSQAGRFAVACDDSQHPGDKAGPPQKRCWLASATNQQDIDGGRLFGRANWPRSTTPINLHRPAGHMGVPKYLAHQQAVPAPPQSAESPRHAPLYGHEQCPHMN